MNTEDKARFEEMYLAYQNVLRRIAYKYDIPPDYIDDVDAYPGMPFTRFYADCIGSGTPILWEEAL